MLEKLDQIFVQLYSITLSLVDRLFPEWMVILTAMLIPVVFFAFFAPVMMMYLTWLERKLIGRIQNRYGPNRVGIFGLLQPIADAVKMLTKEDIVPRRADKIAHLAAPILIIIPALLVFALLPFGRNMIAADLRVGLLMFLALSSTTTIFIFAASWGSRSKFSLLGGMRTVAQMVSYEIPFVLAVVPVILLVGSFSTVDMVEAQSNWRWFVFTPWGLVAFVTFFLCGVAEVNRTPFDLPEAESELVAGFHTEYSGMKFALFYMAEYMNVFTVSALAVTLFLGGWHGSILPGWIWFFLKTYALICVMMWFRGTFPRIRIDQLMGFAWKFLLPLGLLNIFAAGLWYFFKPPVNHVASAALLIFGILLLVALNKPDVPKKRIYRFEYAD